MFQPVLMFVFLKNFQLSPCMFAAYVYICCSLLRALLSHLACSLHMCTYVVHFSELFSLPLHVRCICVHMLFTSQSSSLSPCMFAAYVYICCSLLRAFLSPLACSLHMCTYVVHFSELFSLPLHVRCICVHMLFTSQSSSLSPCMFAAYVYICCSLLRALLSPLACLLHMCTYVVHFSELFSLPLHVRCICVHMLFTSQSSSLSPCMFAAYVYICCSLLRALLSPLACLLHMCTYVVHFSELFSLPLHVRCICVHMLFTSQSSSLSPCMFAAYVYICCSLLRALLSPLACSLHMCTYVVHFSGLFSLPLHVCCICVHMLFTSQSSSLSPCMFAAYVYICCSLLRALLSPLACLLHMCTYVVHFSELFSLPLHVRCICVHMLFTSQSSSLSPCMFAAYVYICCSLLRALLSHLVALLEFAIFSYVNLGCSVVYLSAVGLDPVLNLSLNFFR